MPAILNKTVGSISERKILIEYWGEGSKDTYNPECKWKSDDRLYVLFYWNFVFYILISK